MPLYNGNKEFLLSYHIWSPQIILKYHGIRNSNFSCTAGILCPIHVVTFTLISNLLTDYIQREEESYMDRALVWFFVSVDISIYLV